VDAEQVAVLRELLAPTGWLERVAGFASALRHPGRSRGGLLVVGTPGHEPWHLAAHLDEESRLAGLPELAPTLVRWAPPPGAPPHLSVGLGRLATARRGESVLVAAPELVPAPLLERVHDARRGGATVLAMDCGDSELAGLAHEALTVGPAAPLSFDAAEHLVSSAAAVPPAASPGLRARLARLLDLVSGPAGR
jgi:hypothetical protein